MDLANFISRAIREDRVVHVDDSMIGYPEPDTVYWSQNPSHLDIVEKEWYQGAILEPIEFGLRFHKQLDTQTIMGTNFNVYRYTCRGAKVCQTEICPEAVNWLPSSARRVKCPECNKAISSIVKCRVVFYYLEEQHADEKIQILYCKGYHSHGTVTPNKIPVWFQKEIERLAQTTDIRPSDIHNGEKTKFNMFAHCLALSNLDKVGQIISSARRSAIGVLYGARSCPTESVQAIRSLVEKNRKDLMKRK